MADCLRKLKTAFTMLPNGKKPKRKQLVTRPVAGTKLIREHNGQEHHVTVLAKGRGGTKKSDHVLRYYP